MFVDWGRRGALAQFALEAGRAAIAAKGLVTTISVPRSNEAFASYEEFGYSLFPIDTYRRSTGAALQAWRIPVLRQQLYQRLRQDRTQAVIELMPHVWSPMLMPVVRKAGARYSPVIHDADGHPGDRATLVKGLIDVFCAKPMSWRH